MRATEECGNGGGGRRQRAAGRRVPEGGAEQAQGRGDGGCADKRELKPNRRRGAREGDGRKRR